jgi:hypothetical protein
MDRPNPRHGSQKHMRSPRISLFSLAVLGTLLIGGAVSAFGQTSAIRSGSVEIGPFVGASYGIDKFHVMAGGNITYALKNKWVLPYFEYSYFPGIPHSVSVPLGSGQTVTDNHTVSFSDVHGGVHVRLPIFREKPVIPYLVFGMGTMIYPGRTDTASGTLNGQPVTVMFPVSGGSDFTINGGGGIRYYIGKTGTVGLRTEAKFYKIINGDFSGTTFGKVEVGFFIQLH